MLPGARIKSNAFVQGISRTQRSWNNYENKRRYDKFRTKN